MSRASQLEHSNDESFHALSNKISVFKNIASEINGYAQEDQGTLSNLNNQMSALGDGIKDTAAKLTTVMASNPKVTRMVFIGFFIVIIFWYGLGIF
ncbi:hypothetical protein DAMA08_047880 [Martiniozyma asiatica (nom. inval.)]|nr:hypothetical protein DAMA08_047880 [Martiniozyma asiatica]